MTEVENILTNSEIIDNDKILESEDDDFEYDGGMDSDDRITMFEIETGAPPHGQNNFERDLFVGIKHRPKKPDVINTVSINTPYNIDLKAKQAQFTKYEEDHFETLKSFSDKDRLVQFMQDRYLFDKNYMYLYDHRWFDLPLDLMLYIWCVDHDIDLEFKPMDKYIEYNDFEGILTRYYPDYRVGDKYVCIRPSYGYDSEGNPISTYPVWYLIAENPMDGQCDKLIDNDFKVKEEKAKEAGIIFWNENSLEMEEINQWIYDHYSDDYVPLFKLGIPFPWPNADLRDTSPMGLIRHFHKSIYEGHYKKEPSALDIWDNKDVFKRLALNRLLYVGECNPNRMLHGLNIAKISVKCTVFKSTLATELIAKYLWDAKNLVDPFSGFSGRMFGAIANGIPYFGRDINEKHVAETNQIIEYLKTSPRYNSHLPFIDVRVADAITSYGIYDCLFTCSPYADIEDWNNPNQVILSCDQWIDVCLTNYRCRKYLFVVDDTIVKYRPYIVGTISNYGHIARNVEFVVYLDFTNYNDGYITPNGCKGITPFDGLNEDSYAKSIGQGVTPFDIIR